MALEGVGSLFSNFFNTGFGQALGDIALAAAKTGAQIGVTQLLTDSQSPTQTSSSGGQYPVQQQQQPGLGQQQVGLASTQTMIIIGAAAVILVVIVAMRK